MPYGTLFYFWLQWKTGHHPLGIPGIRRVQAFNKGKCPNSAQGQLSSAPAPAHSAPFPPSQSSHPLFSLINMAKPHLLPDPTSSPAGSCMPRQGSVRGTAEHHCCPVPGPNTAGCAGSCRCFAPTLTNILLPAELLPAPVGVQYTDMDLRSRENSRVHSFLISCLITCRNSAGLSQDVPGTLLLSALADNPAEPQDGRRKATTGAREDGTGVKACEPSTSERNQEIYYNLHRPIQGRNSGTESSLSKS